MKIGLESTRGYIINIISNGKKGLFKSNIKFDIGSVMVGIPKSFIRKRSGDMAVSKGGVNG